jgi:hypothetical protein
MCAGGALCVVRALDWWCVLFASVWFCLGCVESLPLPKGCETCSSPSDLAFRLFFGFRSLIGFISHFFSFPFFSGYQILCVVNALIKGDIEDHVWFENRWMVAPWSDE